MMQKVKRGSFKQRAKNYQAYIQRSHDERVGFGFCDLDSVVEKILTPRGIFENSYHPYR
jgi:hypothetical protein